MKKLSTLISIALASSSFAFALPSGVFVGANVGAHLGAVGSESGERKGNIQVSQTSNSQTFKSTLYQAVSQGKDLYIDPTVGFRSGVIYSLNSYNAFRANATFDFTPFTLKDSGPKTTKNLFQAGVGLDYLLSFDNYDDAFGLSVGGGFDFAFGDFANYFKSQQNPAVKKSLHLPYLQVGFYKGIGGGSQVLDFGVKVPFGEYVRYPGDANNSLTVLGTTITGAYSAGTSFVAYLRYAYNFKLPISEY
ncbi:MAG: hypothetical protein E7K04_00245 [Helicobacter sp.]|nr:hypothetical protein [Helicobacter sp.]